MIARHNWLDRFVDYTLPFGEAPEHMYWWVGISTIAATLRRRVWLDRGTYTIWPNLYVMIVAPPGVVQKSTTLAQGVGIIKAVPGVRLGPKATTWQQLYKEFQTAAEESGKFQWNGEEMTEAAVVCFVSELGTFIDTADKQFQQHLIDFWDGESGRKSSLTNGDFELRNPIMSIVGCTTPEWFSSSFKEQEIGGGFLSRFIIVHANEASKIIENPAEFIEIREKELGVRRSQIKTELIEDLRSIAEIVGPFELTPDAKAWMKQWYTQHKLSDIPAMPTIMQLGYAQRKHTMIYKIAMCLSAGRAQWPTIDLATVQEAERLITALEEPWRKVMQGVGISKTTALADKIVELVRRRPTTLSLLRTQTFRMLPEGVELDRVVDGMVKAALLVREGASIRVGPAAGR